MSLRLPESISDHPSLVGIVRMPTNTYSATSIKIPIVVKEGNIWQSKKQRVEIAREIIGTSQADVSVTIPKSSLTDFYPYTYYVLTDNECEPLIMEAQYMNSTSVFCSQYALSHQPVERYYCKGYKGDNYGRIHNITNMSQMMLPTATNEGSNYMSANASALASQRQSNIVGNMLGAVNLVTSIASGNPFGVASSLSNNVSSIMQVRESMARNKDIMLTPSTISSWGTPSTRDKFNTNNVRLVKMTVKDNVKNRINNFVDRYGNKYNNYATVDIKNYKGYIKYISPKIEGDIDSVYLQKIIDILERGVYCE